MTEIFIVLGIMAIGMTYFALQDEKYYKMLKDGYKPNAKDGDGDGIVQEGTKWERKL